MLCACRDLCDWNKISASFYFNHLIACTFSHFPRFSIYNSDVSSACAEWVHLRCKCTKQWTGIDATYGMVVLGTLQMWKRLQEISEQLCWVCCFFKEVCFFVYSLCLMEYLLVTDISINLHGSSNENDGLKIFSISPNFIAGFGMLHFLCHLLSCMMQ